MKLVLPLLALASALGAPCQVPVRANPTPTPQSAAALPQPKTPFAGLIAEYLRMDAAGHSPRPDEIAAMANLSPAPDPASIQESMPYLIKALENPDVPLRTFALTALNGLQTSAAVEGGGPPSPSAYKPEVARVITPSLAQIGAHLASEDGQQNRLLVVSLLAGFTPDPPPAAYLPLTSFLKRDDAVSPVGLAVVNALLGLGPLPEDAAGAIGRYLRRADQTGDSRANLAEAIAGARFQSQTLNRAMLGYLDSDDASLRARVILLLPQLDLANDVFADMQSRVQTIAANPNESLQVVTAAKAVSSCWKETKMTSGCPSY